MMTCSGSCLLGQQELPCVTDRSPIIIQDSLETDFLLFLLLTVVMYRTSSSVVVRASSQLCSVGGVRSRRSAASAARVRGRSGELTPRGPTLCSGTASAWGGVASGRPAWAQRTASGRPSRARHATSARGRRGGLHGERLPSRTWDAASARRHRGGRRSERARPAWRGRGQRGGRRGHRARRAGGRRGHGMRRECAAGAKVGTATMGLLRSGALPQRGTSGPSKEARMATRSRRTAGWQVEMPCSALFLQLARVPGQPALVVVGRPH